MSDLGAYTSELAAALGEDLLQRFTRYVRVDTEAKPRRTQCPSTPGQLELGRMLVEELQALGLTDAEQDENGYVFATLPGEGPVIGILAHLDTSPDASGHGVEPLVHRAYDGGVIELPRNGTRLDPESMPLLSTVVGQDVVTASGDTLLGADDKAGVAAIMAAVAYLQAHPELPRTTLRIGFTPDEEIGEGATLFDLDRFGARFAYTLDASTRGELQVETFSAKGLTITFEGVDIHPGSAHGKLVNAARLAGHFLASLPDDRLTPETTQGREGFVHVSDVEGTAFRTVVRMIARDFDDTLLDAHVDEVRRLAEAAAAREPRARVSVEVVDQYPNMKVFLDPHPELVELADRAIRAEGIEPIHNEIRGGTDGSRLSAMGLPTPNLFAGGHEFHSVREWASLQDMAAAAAVVVRLAGEWRGQV